MRMVFSIAHETLCRRSHTTNGKRQSNQLRTLHPRSPAPKPLVFPCGGEEVEGLKSRRSSSPRSELCATGRPHLVLLQHQLVTFDALLCPSNFSCMIYSHNSSRKSRKRKNLNLERIRKDNKNHNAFIEYVHEVLHCSKFSVWSCLVTVSRRDWQTDTMTLRDQLS